MQIDFMTQNILKADIDFDAMFLGCEVCAGAGG
jgi:hypothetical protein